MVHQSTRWRGSTWTILGHTRRSSATSAIMGWRSSFFLSLSLSLFLSNVRSLTSCDFFAASKVEYLLNVSVSHVFTEIFALDPCWIVNIAIHQTDAINRTLILSHYNNHLNHLHTCNHLQFTPQALIVLMMMRVSFVTFCVVKMIK